MLYTKSKLTVVASVMAAALAAPGIAQADAVAQSILNVTEFTFRLGNGTSDLSNNQLVFGAAPTVQNTGDVFAKLVGSGTADDSAGPTSGGFSISECVGPGCGSYSPGTQLAGAPTATFAGSTSTLSGSALQPPAAGAGANALTDNTVSLAPAGDGTAQGNVNLNAQFTFATGQAQIIEINFFADAFLRSFLDGLGVASAGIDWSVTIQQNQGGVFVDVFNWAPDGTAGGIVGGTEYLDPFNLGAENSTITADNVVFDPAKSRFHAETNLLQPGTYKVTINHIARADATIERVPEPATLSLLGLGLLAAAGVAKRRRAA